MLHFFTPLGLVFDVLSGSYRVVIDEVVSNRRLRGSGSYHVVIDAGVNSRRMSGSESFERRVVGWNGLAVSRGGHRGFVTTKTPTAILPPYPQSACSPNDSLVLEVAALAFYQSDPSLDMRAASRSRTRPDRFGHSKGVQLAGHHLAILSHRKYHYRKQELHGAQGYPCR